MAILGFDLSTSIIGISCLDDDGKLLFIDYINLKKIKGTVIDKLDEAFKQLETKKIKDKISKFGIKIAVAEAALEKFTTGKSTAHVILMLAAFNQSFTYHFYKTYGVPIQYYTFAEARKKFGIKIPTQPKETKAHIKSKLKKEFIVGCVSVKWPEIIWQKNKNGNHCDWNYDIADALVIAANHVGTKTKNS